MLMHIMGRTYKFDDSIPRIGINDVALVVDCDYALVGSDTNNHKWLRASRLYKLVPTIIPQNLYSYPQAYKYKSHPDITQALDKDHLFRYTSWTASMGVGLAKRIGFDNIVAVGFGDREYAHPWSSGEPERYELDIDHDSVKTRIFTENRCLKHRNMMKEVADKLKIDIELI